MNLRYRIVTSVSGELYRIERFEGIWIFGNWVGIYGTCKSIEEAEERITEISNTVLNSRDKVIKEIIIKSKTVIN